MSTWFRTSTLLPILIAGPISAQKSAPAPGAPKPVPATDVVVSVQGTVLDLSRDLSGRILYCTKEKEVGRIDPKAYPGNRKTILATAVNFPTAVELRAVAENLNGDVTLAESNGDIFVLPGNAPPAVQVYDDLYMILDVTDLIIDARGNHLLASSTPSSGTRGTNRVSPDGSRWGYYVVRHSPLQLAADPLTGDVLLADAEAGGALRIIDSHCTSHPISALDTITKPGGTSAQSDGDLACEADGDVYWIAGSKVWFHSRSSRTTALFASGFQQLRGIVIASESGRLANPTGWSLYVAEGEFPTLIRELPGVGAPGGLVATDQGYVPDRGQHRLFAPTAGIQIWTITTDNSGDLLLGGHLFQTAFSIVRYDTTTKAAVTVANQSNGLSGPIQGLVVAPDDSIYALTRAGVIHKVTENPLTVTTVFNDSTDKITFGCDLALDVNGAFYAADRDAWGVGEVLEILGGVANTLVPANEARGLSAVPGGGLFVTQWNNQGFHGTVNYFDFGSGSLNPIPGFDRINYSNGNADGDTVVDVLGRVTSVSEDDWSVVSYELAKSGFTRIASGYTKALSGVDIAPSTPGSGSTTGWSLYVSDFDNLWEIPNSAAPASPYVDSSVPLRGAFVASIPPWLGEPRAMLADLDMTRLFVSTSSGGLIEIDLRERSVTPLEGEAAGGLAALARLVDARLIEDRRAGILFAVDRRTGSATSVFAAQGGAIAFDGQGNAYLAGGGRVTRVDRRGGTPVVLSGGFVRPTALALAGEGPRKQLFVLDRGSIYVIDDDTSPPSWTGGVQGR